MESPSGDLLEQINKRFTLNLLIQGAATHAFLTAHHLVKGELDAIHPKLVRNYDCVAAAGLLNYWYGDLVLVQGTAWRFWRRVRCAGHPFRQHCLLVEHGPELARATKQRLKARNWEKGVVPWPGVSYLQGVVALATAAYRERRHRRQLEALARRAASEIWGLDESRLDGRLGHATPFGQLQESMSLSGTILRAAAAGYGGVLRVNSRLTVVARAWVWPLLLHELVKGTAELVCLHGLNELDDETYAAVVEAADKIEYETWLMTAGAELWRRLLTALPPGASLAETVMHLARLSPGGLENVMLAVVREGAAARPRIAALASRAEWS